jgi:hypothetical protein
MVSGQKLVPEVPPQTEREDVFKRFGTYPHKFKQIRKNGRKVLLQHEVLNKLQKPLRGLFGGG